MSIELLLLDQYKPWCNIRVNNISVDGTATINNLTVIDLTATNLTVSNNLTVGNTINTMNVIATNTVETPVLQSAPLQNLTIGSGSGTIYMGNGIALPTVGGTATVLDYYEVYGTAVTFNNAIPNTTVDLLFTRIGGMVYLKIESFANTTSSYSGTRPITGTAVIPTSFLPQNLRQTIIIVAAASQQAIGIVTIDTSGNINIYSGYSGGALVGFGSLVANTGIVGDQTVVYDVYV